MFKHTLPHKILLLWALSFLAFAVPAQAQTGEARINSEDVLAVIVLNHPEMSIDPVTVGANGSIQAPIAGSVFVVGKTLSEAAAEIAQRLRGQLRNPRVNVILRQARAERVFVLGAVQKPGVYDLPKGGGVAEALAIAGGGAANGALARATIKRADGTTVPVDLIKAARLPEHNLALQAGDVLLIPESQARITVRGAVGKPGVYDIADGASIPVSEALALAGGAAPKAALSRAQVTRADGTTVPVDLFKAISLGQPEANISLQSGDILTIPTAASITVLGAVQRPGVLDVADGGVSLAEALGLAGGLNVPPAQARISISRTAADGQTQISSVDPVKLLSLREAGQNLRLQEGDLVSVSSKEAQTVFVSGEVKTPGAYEVKEGDSVAELIVRAGGPTPLASLARISVVKRDGTPQTLNLAAPLIEGNAKALDFPLQQGDFVVVPKNNSVVLVLGAVQQPGRYPIPETGLFTLGDALAAAGGARDRAKVKEIMLLRQDANAANTPAGTIGKFDVPGQPGLQRQIVSVQGAQNGQLALNQPLQAGTIVYVPEGKQVSGSWGLIISSLSILSRLLF